MVRYKPHRAALLIKDRNNMKTFVLIILLGSNTAVNGPSMIDGFTTEAACEAAGEKIAATLQGGFVENSASPMRSKFHCVEITK